MQTWGKSAKGLFTKHQENIHRMWGKDRGSRAPQGRVRGIRCTLPRSSQPRHTQSAPATQHAPLHTTPLLRFTFMFRKSKDRTRESIYQERWEIRTWNITRKTWEKVLEPGNTNESSLTVQQWEALNRCLKWWMGVAGYWAAGVLAKSESPQWGGGEEETGESEGEKKQ